MNMIIIKRLRQGVIGSLCLLSGLAHASFQLETMTVIVDAGEPRKVFSVKNTGKEPILLSTKVSDIEGGQALAQDVMVSPPIIRIEPEQSQQLNFVLKKGLDLTDEVLLKVSFQGVGATKTNAAKMPIRQDVAMLIMPSGMSVSPTPWDTLKVTQTGNILILKNTGKQVIRLAPNFTGQPAGQVYSLGQFYLRPGEQKTVDVKGALSAIDISPLSRYGFKMQNNATIKVTPAG
ncbi:fimbria/pilus chaperone family protein [Moellerella wisconsensis]|uniref:Beta-fimbriae chaperone protein n=1 Tax=Moellerella wisconsensis ATCC 35017 TaxID=1354267 RepID=A0A0N0I944_9GAMM|nr:fimbria/pilus chaperone family protein [Moellerella wisconsensis]KPD01852.1 beta-fimbriae chaperone protein [Moellerella wisconsensis ATCC 35017]VFS54489.1 putative fimbrial chaperone protein [Moellerella wisconsensis]